MKVWGCFVLFISELKASACASLSRPRERISPIILGVQPFNMQHPASFSYRSVSIVCELEVQGTNTWEIGTRGCQADFKPLSSVSLPPFSSNLQLSSLELGVRGLRQGVT